VPARPTPDELRRVRRQRAANSGSLSSADGVFYLGSAVRLEDISDGTTNTAAFADRQLGDGAPGPPDPRRAMREIRVGGDTTAAACQPPNGVVEPGARGEVDPRQLREHAVQPRRPARTPRGSTA
jgi:hypothetical protein